jgi:molybdate transport system substrate-binding protein
MHVAGVDYVGTIPAELQPGFTFAGVLTRSAQEVEASAALLRFLNSAEAASVIIKAGLLPAAGH